MQIRVGWLALLLWSGVAGGLQAQRADPTGALMKRLQRDGGRVIIGLRPLGAQRGMQKPGVRGLSMDQARQIAADLRSHGFTAHRHFRVITAASGTIAPGKLAALRSHPNVEYVQPDYINSVDDDIGGTLAETIPYGVSTIRAPDAWAASAPPSYGAGVRVGILDTGGDSLHEDLSYAGGYDVFSGSSAAANWADTIAVCHGHGTHVAGTVAAIRDNGSGVVGVAPAVSLYAIKIFEPLYYDDVRCGAFTSSELAGFDWAVQNGIQVINMSYGKQSYDEAEHQAIQALVARGVVFVAAAGNSSGAVIYPAANREVIAVAATDSLDARAYFSSFGPEVDVAAPGVGVYSTLPNNQYAAYNGTSMASPHVTGLAALLLALNPKLTVAQVRTYITGWAVDLGPLGVDDEFGFGRVDALASVTALLGPPPPTLSILRQPDGAVWGRPLTQQPVVQLVDASGQPIAQPGIPVSATVVSGTGRISGMGTPAIGAAGKPATKASRPAQVQAVTLVTDQNGTAEFTNLTISGLGPHVLEFSAPGHTPVYSQVFTVTVPPPTPLTNGVPVTGIEGSWGSLQYWTLTVPAEAFSVTFTTSDGWGDVDLYVRRGMPTDLDSWECGSWSYTTYESCSLSGDVTGEWYVLLYAYSDFGGVTLRGEWRPAPVASLLHLAQEPGGAPAGELLYPQPVVELRDSQDQPVPLSGVTVTVTANRPGILTDATPPVLQAVTDAQGRATFDGLVITEPGIHALIFSAPDLATASSQSVAVSQPLPSIDVIGQELVGSNQLSHEHEIYLDALGNADGVFNLGDFMALLDRVGVAGSTATATRCAGRPAATCRPAGRSNRSRRLP